MQRESRYSVGTRVCLGVGVVLAACGPTDPPVPASPTTELAPDPISRPHFEDEVRREAVRLATQAFAERHFVGADGARVSATFDPAELTVERDGFGWRCVHTRPAGASMLVTMGAFGESPTVEVGFADQ